jgi:hypothetical protein
MTDSSGTDVLRGTLDLLVITVLTAGPMHGWGISQRLQQRSRGMLEVNQGSLYPALGRGRRLRAWLRRGVFDANGPHGLTWQVPVVATGCAWSFSRPARIVTSCRHSSRFRRAR